MERCSVNKNPADPDKGKGIKMNERPTICIMADFGNGPYAWLRPANESAPYVGTNIADTITGFPEAMNVSKSLESDFVAWVTLFECHYDEKSFDWAAWNKQGIALAKKLKDFVGEVYSVEYHYPMECPVVLEPSSIIEIM